MCVLSSTNVNIVLNNNNNDTINNNSDNNNNSLSQISDIIFVTPIRQNVQCCRPIRRTYRFELNLKMLALQNLNSIDFRIKND